LYWGRCNALESKGTREGWLEKVLKAGQDRQRVLVPIIIIIIITGVMLSIQPALHTFGAK
jgi:hypothetical protein